MLNVWLVLLWQRRPCHPQPELRSEIWSHSLCWSWRNAESGSSPAPWGQPEVRRQCSQSGSSPHCFLFAEDNTHASKSLLAMLKWDDGRMLQPSRLFTVVAVIKKVNLLKECIHLQNRTKSIYIIDLTLKVHIAQVKDSSEQFEDFLGVIVCEGEDLQSWAEVSVLLHIITSFTTGAVTLVTGNLHFMLLQSRLEAWHALL